MLTTGHLPGRLLLLQQLLQTATVSSEFFFCQLSQTIMYQASEPLRANKTLGLKVLNPQTGKALSPL